MDQTGKYGVNEAIKKLKLHYQKAIRTATTEARDPPGYRKYTEEGVSH